MHFLHLSTIIKLLRALIAPIETRPVLNWGPTNGMVRASTGNNLLITLPHRNSKVLIVHVLKISSLKRSKMNN